MSKKILVFFLLIFNLSAWAQITVVDQDLFALKDVQLMSGSTILATSDANGKLNINTDSLDLQKTRLVLMNYKSIALTPRVLEESNKVIVMSPSNYIIPEVFISKGRSARQLRDIASDIHFVKSKDVEFYQPSTTAELLTINNKVFVQKSQAGGGSPMIRGFATNRILLVVDGVRMNTAIFRSGNVQNSISIDPFSIEKSEVIFGPASQFYGSDAIGGVLSFNTKRAKHSYTDSMIYDGSAALRIGTVNAERAWHFDFNLGTKKLASYSSISFSSFGHLDMGKNGPEAYQRKNYQAYVSSKDTVGINPNPNKQLFTDYNQLNALQKISYRPNKNIELIYTLQYAISSDVNRYDRMILTDDQGDFKNAQWYYGPQKWFSNRASLTYKKKNKMFDRIGLIVANQQFEESRHTREFDSKWLNNRTENVLANSINIDAEKRLKNRFIIFYGAEYVHNRVNSVAVRSAIDENLIAGLSTRYPDGSTWQSVGTYINAYKKFNKHYKFEAGARYNHVVSKAELDTTAFFSAPSYVNSNQAVTGSISHIFSKDKTTFSVITSTAFRAPNIDDLSKVFDSNDGFVILPNTELKPEYAYNGELRIVQGFGKKIKLSASGFYTYLDNAIVTVNSTYNGADSILYDSDSLYSKVQILDNSDFAAILGVQLDASIQISKQLKLRSNYTFLQSGFNNQTPVRHITPNFGGTELTYRDKKTTISALAQYNQEFNSDRFPLNELQDNHLYLTNSVGELYSPSWATFTVRGAYQWTSNVTINLALENIFNKRYRVYSSGIAAPGRNFVLSMQARF